ncbi:MAG: EndoU domain-containing protein [Verrucomicrobia bacterium]|nr:EndoU domain-containing protein [Verrucomicrobiota bacterium]
MHKISGNKQNFYFPLANPSKDEDFDIKPKTTALLEEDLFEDFPNPTSTLNDFSSIERPKTPTTPEEANITKKIVTTPKKTPTASKPSVEKFRQFMKSEDTSQPTLPANKMQKLTDNLDQIVDKTPPMERPHVARKLYAETLNAFEDQGRKRKIVGDTQPSKRACVSVDQETLNQLDGSWVQTILSSFKKMYHESKPVGQKELPLLVNETHIVEVGDKGFHLAEPNNEHCISVIIEDALSGIRFGKFKTPKDQSEKKSTFFPRTWTFSNVLKMLSEATLVAQGNGRALMETKSEPFKIEVLQKAGGSVAWSVYPIWYYAPYDKTAQYLIFANPTYSSQQILLAGRDSRSKTVYELKDGSLIVDIAPSLQGCPIDRGVYITFTKAELDNS